jgi:hypothetical protein
MLSGIASLAIIVGHGVFRPLTQHRERSLGAVFRGRKSIAHRA